MQRNIGFEFENPMIHIRTVPNASKVASAGRAGKLTAEEWPPEAPKPIEPKKPVLALGEGPGTLEADDTLGTGKEDVEIVVPRLAPFNRGFPISDDGEKAMATALEVAATFATTAGGIGREHAIDVGERRTGAFKDIDSQHDVWIQEHTAKALLKNKALLKLATAKSKSSKLGPVPDYKRRLKQVRDYQKLVVKKGNKAGPPPWGRQENPMDTIRADLATRGFIRPKPSRGDLPELRVLTAVSEFWPDRDDLVLADAGHADMGWAVHVTTGIPVKALKKKMPDGFTTGMHALAHLKTNAVPHGEELDGFMRLVASYLWGAKDWESNTKSKNPKQMVGLLARNSFATMFGMIPLATRLAIARQPDVWIAAWATESKSLGSPFLSKPGVIETDYTRAEWLRAMIGTVSEEKHVEGTDLIAGDKALDSMGKWTELDKNTDGEDIPILEDRRWENWSPSTWVGEGQKSFAQNRDLLEG